MYTALLWCFCPLLAICFSLVKYAMYVFLLFSLLCALVLFWFAILYVHEQGGLGWGCTFAES